MNWGALDWSDQLQPAKPAAPALARNRLQVVIIICPECASRRVQRHSVVGGVAYWQCLDCPARWKESASVGETGKGHIA